MPYDIPAYPKLAFPPSPIACVPKALGLSWANYARDFCHHQDADFTRMEAGSSLGGAILRQYFPSVAGFRRRRVWLGLGWGTPEMAEQSQVLEDVAGDDVAMWIVEKRREKEEGAEEGEEEGVFPSVEVPEEDYDVHTILLVITHGRFLMRKERKAPSLLPLLGPGFVVGGREVTIANVVLLTGEQPPMSPQFEFYKLKVEGPTGRDLVPTIGTKKEIFDTNAFKLETDNTEKLDRMWKATVAGELKMRATMRGRGPTRFTSRDVSEAEETAYGLAAENNNATHTDRDTSAASTHNGHASKSSAIYAHGVAEAVKNRKRKQTSRATSAEATDAEKTHARVSKRQKTSQAKPKVNHKQKKQDSGTALSRKSSISKPAPSALSLSHANSVASSSNRFSPALLSTSIQSKEQDRSDTTQNMLPPPKSSQNKRKRASTLESNASATTSIKAKDSEQPRKKKQKKTAIESLINSALRDPALSKRFGCPFTGCKARYSNKDSVRRHFMQKHAGFMLDLASWQLTAPDGVVFAGQDIVQDAEFTATVAKEGVPEIGGPFYHPNFKQKWAEFTVTSDICNPNQAIVDLGKENQLWHYLGAISTMTSPKYTEHSARERYNTTANFV